MSYVWSRADTSVWGLRPHNLYNFEEYRAKKEYFVKQCIHLHNLVGLGYG